MIHELTIQTPGRGLHEFTHELASLLARANPRSGLCTLMIRHTSASLLIQENADPSARQDLETWLDRFVPDGTGWRHTAEGPEDMPSHIRAAITATSLSIPVDRGRLVLGTWQGVYLWEHRTSPHTRHVVVHLLSDPKTDGASG